MGETSVEIEWHGRTLRLLPERALWWGAQRTLVLADVHLGKPAAFRAAGAPAPESITRADLARLESLVERWDPQRLIVAGDFVHARAGMTRTTLDALSGWRRRRPGLNVTVVRGNHDRAAGSLPAELSIDAAEPPLEFGGLCVAHDPDEAPAKRPTLCGHLHPGVSLAPRGGGKGGRLRAACFWFGDSVAVLPAFGGFTGLQMVRPGRGDRMFVIGEGAVVEAPTAVAVPRARRAPRRSEA